MMCIRRRVQSCKVAVRGSYVYEVLATSFLLVLTCESMAGPEPFCLIFPLFFGMKVKQKSQLRYFLDFCDLIFHVSVNSPTHQLLEYCATTMFRDFDWWRLWLHVTTDTYLLKCWCLSSFHHSLFNNSSGSDDFCAIGHIQFNSSIFFLDFMQLWIVF